MQEASKNSQPNTPPLRLDDRTTWVNAAVPYYTVQGLPQDAAFAVGGYSAAVLRDYDCGKAECWSKGSQYYLRRGVTLPRAHALHLHNHLLYPNQSITRWTSSACVQGATDLIFEIDAHRLVPSDGLDIVAYIPLVRDAVTVGRRLYDYVTRVLNVHTKYITTSATRMGARVTVDWRAFGPYRPYEIRTVLRWIETQVFDAGELAELRIKNGYVADVLDAGLYEDLTDMEPQEDGTNRRRGHWCRPLGALHSRSNGLVGYARATPFDHDAFRPENAEYLTFASRGATSANVSKWSQNVWHDWRKWPEVRDPKFDHLVEDEPVHAEKLIELFDQGPSLVQEVREELRSTLRKQVYPYVPKQRDPTKAQYDDAVLRKVADHLGLRHRDGEKGLQIECPRSVCRRDGLKGILYWGSGQYSCFRCTEGVLPLPAFASELGCSHLVPKTHNSNVTYMMVPRSETAPNPFSTGWPLHTDHWVTEASSIEESHTTLAKSLDKFLSDADQRIMFLTGKTGTGKSYGVTDVVKHRNLVVRTYGPRDTVNQQLQEMLPDAKWIKGRRLDENCWNKGLPTTQRLREDVAETLCSKCPFRAQCEESGYLSQFAKKHEGSLILHHNHANVSDLERFSNNSVVDFVDEDSLGAIVGNIDLGARELELFSAAITFQSDEDGTYGARAKPVRAPTSSRMGVLVRELMRLSQADVISALAPHAVKPGSLADLDLARHLFGSDELREAVHGWDTVEGDLDPDLSEAEQKRALQPDTWPFYAARAWLQELGADNDTTLDEVRQRPPNVLPQLIEVLRYLLRLYEHNYSAPTPMQLVRTGKLDWKFRLTTKAPFLSSSSKIIHATATAVPERMRHVYGLPSPGRKWLRVQCDPPDATEVTYIADRSWSMSGLDETRKGGKELRARMLETVAAVIRRESGRTGLPTGVIGVSGLVNSMNQLMLGKEFKREFVLPLQGTADQKREIQERLDAATRSKNYICGHTYGVSGLNSFEENGRFVRALLILGAPYPALNDVAAQHRGLYGLPVPIDEQVGYDVPDFASPGIDPLPIYPDRQRPAPDWTVDSRTVGYDGTQDGDYVLAQRNVMGFRDARANALLAGLMEAELVQALGRMRGVIPDPVDPTITPKAYIFAGMPLPGVAAHRVCGLEDIRAEVGLEHAVKTKRGGSKSTLPPDEQLRRIASKRGIPWTLRWLYEGVREDQKPAWRTYARLAFEDAGLPWRDREVSICVELDANVKPH